MASEIHTDDVGTRFLVTVKDDGVAVDLSTATIRQLTFKKPDDSTFDRTASVLSSGSASSGVMYYDSQTSELDQTGMYKLQGKVAFPSGTYYTDIYTFRVNCNL